MLRVFVGSKIYWSNEKSVDMFCNSVKHKLFALFSSIRTVTLNVTSSGI